VLPTFRLQQRRDPRVVVQPHSEIEVMVCSGDRSGVEIDRPATEQPVLNSMIECELAAALFATQVDDDVRGALRHEPPP
jgi:hypothetical protein